MKWTKRRATIHLHTIDSTDRLMSGAVACLDGISFDQWLRLGDCSDDLKIRALAVLRRVNPLTDRWQREIDRGVSL